MNYKGKYTGLLMIAAICLLPVIILILLSLAQHWVYPHLLPETFSIAAWADIFAPYNNISNSIVVSFFIALSVALLSTAGGFITGRLIAYHRYRRQLLLLTYMPFMISPVIFAVCIKYYYIKLHLTGSVAGVILAQMIIAFPYGTIFFLGFWNQRTLQFIQLVQTLGGSANQSFKRILYPMARPMLIVCFFQCFLISWFEYGLTLIIGYGKINTLTLKVFQFLSEANIFYAALSCCLLVIPPIILLWINKRFIIHQMN